MGIPLRVVDKFPPWKDRKPGMIWRYVPGDEDGRECWWIELPRDPREPELSLSFRTTDKAHSPPHAMWEITGSVPECITVNPSIDVMRFKKVGDQFERDGSYWHGFIRNGELVDA